MPRTICGKSDKDRHIKELIMVMGVQRSGTTAVLRVDDGQLEILIDRADQGWSQFAQPAAYAKTVSSNGGLRLGGSDRTTAAFQGALVEVLIFDRALSDTERAGIIEYLNDKYALDV